MVQKKIKMSVTKSPLLALYLCRSMKEFSLKK